MDAFVDLTTVDRVEERNGPSGSLIWFYPERSILGCVLAVDNGYFLNRCDGRRVERDQGILPGIFLPENRNGEIARITNDYLRNACR